MNDKIERCCSCEQPTGRAGKGEDSIYLYGKYDLQEIGPLCEECACTLEQTKMWLPEPTQ
jgi:hypothetical protein